MYKPQTLKGLSLVFKRFVLSKLLFSSVNTPFVNIAKFHHFALPYTSVTVKDGCFV